MNFKGEFKSFSDAVAAGKKISTPTVFKVHNLLRNSYKNSLAIDKEEYSSKTKYDLL